MVAKNMINNEMIAPGEVFFIYFFSTDITRMEIWIFQNLSR